MGGVQTGNPQAMQVFQAINGLIFNMVLWSTLSGQTVHLQGANEGLVAYCMSDRTFATTACSTNSSVAGTPKGGTVVSANGSTAGSVILWITTAAGPQGGAGTLHAFDASDVSKELWNSDRNSSDSLGSFAKFAIPTIAAGKTFVPTFSRQLVVYGLQGSTVTAAPSVNDQGTVNNASFTPGTTSLAPGTIAAIFGTNLNDGSINSSSFLIATESCLLHWMPLVLPSTGFPRLCFPPFQLN
jgi:hypothetical protein